MQEEVQCAVQHQREQRAGVEQQKEPIYTGEKENNKQRDKQRKRGIQGDKQIWHVDWRWVATISRTNKGRGIRAADG